MSSELVKAIQQGAENCAVEAVWAQWTTLTTLATPADIPRPQSIIDPEALVLTSLAMSHLERRLEDILAAWSASAGFLLSKSRFKGLGTVFPDSATQRLGDFARYAADGGESRWRTWAVEATSGSPFPRDKALGRLRLMQGPTLILRLRAGFGVNAKADVLGVLLGLRGSAADLNLISAASGYTRRMVRTATNEMALAGFIHEIKGHPSSFYVEPERWVGLLDFGRADLDDATEPGLPPWRFWAAAFGFLCSVSHWGQTAYADGWSDYVASSKARDLIETYEGVLRQAGVALPSSERQVGSEYLPWFGETVSSVRDWVADSL